jgi:enoyl-CoA hydratase/carnithine racemase
MGHAAGSTGYETISYDVTANAVHVTLSRPDTLNLIGDQVLEELASAFVRARYEEPSVVVLGSSGRYFSAGGDLAGGIAGRLKAAGHMTPDLAAEMYRHVHDDYAAFNAIESCPKTVVAAVNGPAFGAATVLVLLCDLVVASSRAELAFAPGSWGIIDAPSAARLAARVGLGVAKDLLYTARPVDAREAWALGLVNRVVAHGDLADAVGDYVVQLSTTSPGARAGLKRVFARDLPAFAVDEHFGSAISADFVEGVQAFAAGRRPSWARSPAPAPPAGAGDPARNGTSNGHQGNGAGPVPGMPAVKPWFVGSP